MFGCAITFRQPERDWQSMKWTRELGFIFWGNRQLRMDTSAKGTKLSTGGVFMHRSWSVQFMDRPRGGGYSWNALEKNGGYSWNALWSVAVHGSLPEKGGGSWNALVWVAVHGTPPKNCGGSWIALGWSVAIHGSRSKKRWLFTDRPRNDGFSWIALW